MNKVAKAVNNILEGKEVRSALASISEASLNKYEKKVQAGLEKILRSAHCTGIKYDWSDHDWMTFECTLTEPSKEFIKKNAFPNDDFKSFEEMCKDSDEEVDDCYCLALAKYVEDALAKSKDIDAQYGDINESEWPKLEMELQIFGNDD